jgi:hypothetical protein
MTLNQESLEIAATRVLEDVACVFARPLGIRPTPGAGWRATGARLRFRGALRGYMELWAPPEAVAPLAAALLGEDDAGLAAADAPLDAVREMLHVICGSVLALLAGPERAFSLGMPRRRERVVPFTEAERGIEAWLEADGHPVLMRLRVAGLESEPV